MLNFSTIRLIVRGAWQKNFRGVASTPLARARVNLRPDGGWELPSGFVQIVRKQRRAAPPWHTYHTWHTLPYIFSAYVVKISDPGHVRSGHQVTSSDLTS